MFYSLKMILRSWMRNALSTTISIVSLTVGLACSLTLLLYVLDEYKISKALGDTAGVHLVKTQSLHNSNDKTVSMSVMPSGIELLTNTYPEIEYSVMLTGRGNYKWGELKKWDPDVPDIYAVSEHFADLFDIPVEQGDLRSTLSNPGEIAITRSFANRYFQDREPMGEVVESSFTIYRQDEAGNLKPKETKASYRVTTILDDSRKLPLNFSGFYRFSNEEDPSKLTIFFGTYLSFMKFGDGVDPEAFTAKILADTATMKKAFMSNLVFTPVEDMYLTNDIVGQWAGDRLISTRSKSLFYIGITAAMAILLIACFNYINITMTRANSRLRNISGQRIMGATAWSVRWQTVLDTAMSVVVALVLSLCLMVYIMPPFNTFMLSSITLGTILEPLNAAAIAALLLLVVAIPSMFVIIKLESSNPLHTFRSASTGKMGFVKAMVIAQFVVSVVLITVSLTVMRQMNFIVSTISGAEYVVQIGASGEMPTEFTDRVKSDAAVLGYSTASVIPGSSISSPTVSCSMIDCDADFLEFYNIKLVQGRGFEANDTETAMIINESFARAQQLDNPIGYEVNLNGSDRKVIGVVADFMFESAKKSTGPVALMFNKTMAERVQWGMYIKFGDNVEANIEHLRQIWAETVTDKGITLQIKTLATIYRDMNPAENKLQTMVGIFSAISMFLTALGLFGLAWYSVQRRTREIALRKIHGATSGEVVRMLCRSFLGWVAIAFIVAIPVGYYLSAEWLTDFVYRVSLPWWLGVMVALIAACVTLLTVIFQSLSAARANPAKAISSNN